MLTSGTFGQPRTTSSASADLSALLVSRLQAKTQTLGSTLYKLTWKLWVTPLGVSRFRLRASAHRTSETEPTGAPVSPRVTPAARDWKDSAADIALRADGKERFDQLPRQANLAGWQTPLAMDSSGDGRAGRLKKDGNRNPALPGSYRMDLKDEVLMAGWPTPGAHIIEAKSTPPIMGNRKPTDPQISLADVAVHLAAWPTPTANCVTGAGSAGRDGGLNIQSAVQLAGWPTCTVTDAQRGEKYDPFAKNQTLNMAGQLAGWTTPSASDGERAGTGITLGMTGSSLTQMAAMTGPARLTATGQLLTGSTAGMESGGQLNPEHSRWLMGCPEAWAHCHPNYADWRSWQDFLATHSSALKTTELAA